MRGKGMESGIHRRKETTKTNVGVDDAKAAPERGPRSIDANLRSILARLQCVELPPVRLREAYDAGTVGGVLAAGLHTIADGIELVANGCEAREIRIAHSRPSHDIWHAIRVAHSQPARDIWRAIGFAGDISEDRRESTAINFAARIE